MATETVLSDHTSTDEVEKLVVIDEVKRDPQEIAIPSKKTEEETLKAEASSSPQAPSQSAEKLDAETIVLASIIKEIKPVEQETLSSVKENEEVKAIEQQTISPSMETEEENPKAAESCNVEDPSPEAEDEVEDKQIEPSPEQETLSSVQETEEVKSEVEKVKAIEHETVSPSQETEEEKPEAAESESVEAPSSEAAEKMEDKQIEPSPEQETLSSVQETEEEKSEVEKVKEIEHETVSPSQETEEEKPKAAESQSVEAPSPEAAEKMEDKQIEPSPEQETFSSVKETEEEKSEVEEVKAIEQETVAPSKETEEEKPEAAELCSPGAPSPEAEEKQIEPSPIIKQVTLSSVKETEEEISKVEHVKAIEQDPYKKTEEETPKAAELHSPEIEEKMEDEQIEPSPVIKEVEKTGDVHVSDKEVKTIEQESISPSKETEEEEEEPKGGALPSSKAPSPELEEKMVDEQIEPPPEIKEVEKIGDAPPSTEEVKVVRPEAVSPSKETEEEEKSMAENVRTVEKEIISPPSQETQEEKPKDAEQIPEAPLTKSEGKMVGMQTETSSIIGEVEIAVDTPLSYAPAEDKYTTAKELKAIVEETEDSGSGSIKVEKQEQADPEMEEPESTEKVYRESDFKPEASKEIEIAKEEETLADIEPEDTIVLKETQNKKDQEPFPSATAGQLVLTDQEGDGGESSLACVSEEKEVKESENIKEGEAKDVKTESEKEEIVITKEMMQPETLTVEDVGSSISSSEVTGKLLEGGDLNPEEDNKENVIPETSTQPKTNTLEDARGSLATTEVTEKLIEGEEENTTTRDFEQFSAYKKEEALPSVQTDKDKGKLHEVTTADIVQKATESPEAEMEVKGECQETELEITEKGTSKANTDELEKEREVNDAGRSDESPKDRFHEKTSPDQPKQQEVSTKPTQKQSNTIMSKVKQSLAKAKKAITGKSSKSSQRDIKVSSV